MKGSDKLRGSYFDYLAYIEISLLRLTLGKYVRNWSYELDNADLDMNENGLLAGAKLQF